MLPVDGAVDQGGLHLVDVDGADEDVVTDHGEQTVCQVEEGKLILRLGRQYPLDHRLE